jgi:endonuclease/exonuclease/phosphatase family metal-dependent hydrolase
MKIIGSLLLLALNFNALSQVKIKVLTYNIFHGEMAYEAGKPNLDSIAALIRKAQPDFVLCQEVDSATDRSAAIYGKKIDFIKELGAKTGMHSYFGKAMDFEGGGYGEGLLSLAPLSTNTLILPSPSGGEPRALIYANTRLPNGQNIIIGGTHLCHQFAENRSAQSEAIEKTYQGLLVPGIVCGDFNFETSEAAYEVMTRYFRDAAMIRKMVPATYSSKEPTRRIDYAFITKRGNWRVVNAEVFPVKYSDHLPVLFTLEMTINE